MRKAPHRLVASLAALLLAAGLATLAAPDAQATTTPLAALNAALQRQEALHPDAAGRHICYAAHVEDIGWQPPVCDGAVAGTTGQGLRIEALDIVVSGVGGVCAAGHVQDIGWQPITCAGDNVNVMVGTTGEGLRLEALDISVASASVCADAHVQNIGWQGWVCATSPAYATVGTTGQGLRMEAIELTV